MDNAQKLIKALDLLDEADSLIQSIFSGSDRLHDIYEAINNAMEMIEDLASDNGIVLGA